MKNPVISFSQKIGSRCARGQILVEYGLVLLLIALVILLILKGVGLNTSNMYSKINSGVISAMQ